MARLLFGFLYGICSAFVLPLVQVYRWVRKKPTAPFFRRLGFFKPLPEPSGQRVWVHGVSVGEILCARGLVEALLRDRPDLSLVITATTATGLETARRLWPDQEVREAPFDLRFSLRRFLARTGAEALILVELELWPNWIWECKARGIRVAVVNAKISEKSARGYARLSRLGLPLLSHLDLVLAQDEAYAQRFRDHGVPAERVITTGNLKLANAVSRERSPLREELLAEIGMPLDARVFVGGSVHPGEEDALVEAFSAWRAGESRARLILAPRHLERAGIFLQRSSATGLCVGTRSTAARVENPDILILDTLGELARFYAVADVAFLGGTLVPVGGHNPLEPLCYGVPLLLGPHFQTIEDLVKRLSNAGCLAIVNDASALVAELQGIGADPARRARARAGAERVLSAGHGSLTETLSQLDRCLLPLESPLEPSSHG